MDVPSQTPVNTVLGAIASVVSLPKNNQLQHLGRLRFKVVIRSRASVSRILEANTLCIDDQVLPIVAKGLRIILVSCHDIQVYATFFNSYGKIIVIFIATHANHYAVRTGTRLVKMGLKE